MKCSNPVKVHGNIFPCGKCPACRKGRCDDWIARFYCESKSFLRGAVFGTLTYNDDAIPADGNVSSHDISLFIKRVKDRLQLYNLDNFYIFCSEYGELHGRPHYHFLWTGLTEGKVDVASLRHLCEVIGDAWTSAHKGSFVKIEPVVTPAKAIRYIVNYALKNKGFYAIHDGERAADYERRTGKLPPFTRFSHGIGLSYFEKNYQRILTDGFLTFFGSKFRVPRYFLKKLAFMKESSEFKEGFAEVIDFYKKKLKELKEDVTDPIVMRNIDKLYQQWNDYDIDGLALQMPNLVRFRFELNQFKNRLKRRLKASFEKSYWPLVLSRKKNDRFFVPDKDTKNLYFQHYLEMMFFAEQCKSFENDLVRGYFDNSDDFATYINLCGLWNALAADTRSLFLDQIIQGGLNVAAKISKNLSFRDARSKSSGVFYVE